MFFSVSLSLIPSGLSLSPERVYLSNSFDLPKDGESLSKTENDDMKTFS